MRYTKSLSRRSSRTSGVILLLGDRCLILLSFTARFPLLGSDLQQGERAKGTTGVRVSHLFDKCEAFSQFLLLASASSSPVKGKTSVLRAVSSSLVGVSADIISRSFDDQSKISFFCPCLIYLTVVSTVPIYDGRPDIGRNGFGFSDTDFRNLSTWPLYKGGSVELPVESVVSVIYTLGTYRGSAGPVLTSNLISVILLSDS
jgi:hypothetical protein